VAKSCHGASLVSRISSFVSDASRFTSRELFVHERCRIDEPAVASGIDIQRDGSPQREREVTIGQIGDRNGGLVEQRELIEAER